MNISLLLFKINGHMATNYLLSQPRIWMPIFIKVFQNKTKEEKIKYNKVITQKQMIKLLDSNNTFHQLYIV